jgi:predicted ATPase with chaperone activity
VPSSADLRKQVENAKAKSTDRFNSFPWKTNSQIPTRYLRTEFAAEKSGMTFLHAELEVFIKFYVLLGASQIYNKLPDQIKNRFNWHLI